MFLNRLCQQPSESRELVFIFTTMLSTLFSSPGICAETEAARGGWGADAIGPPELTEPTGQLGSGLLKTTGLSLQETTLGV